MVLIPHLHGDIALGPLGFVKKQFRVTTREQEEVGPDLLELVVHIILTLDIADA